MQRDTQKHLQKCKNKLWGQLSENLERHKTELLEDNNRNKENDQDYNKTEKTLKERLETMTKMA